MTTRPLLIELGCEELPARLVQAQAEALASGVQRRLVSAGLVDAECGARRYSTPRRLALWIDAVAAHQPDRVMERKGPAESAAFDADGNPSPAALGFARSVGLELDQLERLETGQGRWLYARIHKAGRSLAEILQEILLETVTEMAGPRSMRWGDRADRFLRPVRWLVVLHGSEPLPVTLFGLDAGRQTRGHRVHAPGWHAIPSADQYAAVLQAARVIVDPAARAARILEQVRSLAESAGLVAALDPELITEIGNLTEWPQAVIGRFDEHFLEVPAEALVSSMKQHQKCVPLRRPDHGLANRFVAVANLDSRDPAAMTAGFERVIRPRLADARFFWDTDRRQLLDQRVARLGQVLFQEHLGSLRDKTRRLESLAAALAPALGAEPDIAARAAHLCKADLLTDMVGEFPDLQGVMGRHYALADGEPAAVADAIENHYRPRHAGDDLPEDPAGQTLALADRLDSLLGLFAANQKPRGGKDPFALRRAALGIIRILETSRCALTMGELLAHAATGLHTQLPITPTLLAEVENFLVERLRSHAAERGIETNTFKAVAAGLGGSIADFLDRAHAVQVFADDPQMASLIAANKRIANLLDQAGADDLSDFDDKILEDEGELALFNETRMVRAALDEQLSRQDYAGALRQLATLKQPVDQFFDQVLVMAENPRLRATRLALIARVRAQFLRIADVAMLGGAG